MSSHAANTDHAEATDGEFDEELVQEPASLAFVAINITGPDPRSGELLEIAILTVDPNTLEVRRAWEHSLAEEARQQADASSSACELPSGWRTASWTFVSVLASLSNATAVGFDVDATLRFLEVKLAPSGIGLGPSALERIDLGALAWPLKVAGELDGCALEQVAAHFDVELPTSHRALDEARASLEVCRRLVQRMRLGGRLAGLAGDESDIVEELLVRMEQGRRKYGAWHVTDGRNYPTEAYAEVLDALHYVAAEMRRLRLRDERRMRRVYICCALGYDSVRGFDALHDIARQLVADGVMPIIPQLFLPGLLGYKTGRDKALAMRLELVGNCDEVRVVGTLITAEMRCEIERAQARGISVRFDREAQS